MKLPSLLKDNLTGLPLLVLLVGFLIIPLGWIVWDSVGGAALDFRHYRRIFSEEVNLVILLRTLKVGALVTFFSLLVAYPVAFLLNRMSVRAMTMVSIFLLIPLFTAFLIRTYAWMVILGREGIVNNFLLWIGLVDEPLKILNTTTAVVIGMVHVFTPMAIFTIYSVMAQIDRNYVQAASILGAHPVRAFTRIFFPLSLPGIFSAAILIFIISIGFYITPSLLGGPKDMMVSQQVVVQMTTLLNFELGYASSVVLLMVTLFTLFIAGLFIPLEKIWSSSAEEKKDDDRALSGHIRKGLGILFMPLVVRSEDIIFKLTHPLQSATDKWLWSYTFLVLLFLVAPLIVVMILSFSASPFVVFPPPGLSLQWWEKLYSAKDWHAAFLFSLKLGLFTALGALIIGTLGAFWLVRTSLRAKRLLFLLSLSPLIVPMIIIAVALYIFEARIGLLGSFPGLLIGHILLASPYVIVVMTTAVRGLDRNLEHAASIHGARRSQIIRMITLPLLKPSLVTAGLLAFITSFDELLVGIFLLGRQTQTLPIKFWGDIKYQIDPLLSTASTLIIIIVTLTILAAQWARLREEKRLARKIEENA